jgi:hypothetical protein
MPRLAVSLAPAMRRAEVAARPASSVRPIRFARITCASRHLTARRVAPAGVARETNASRFKARPTLPAAAGRVYASPVLPARSATAEPAARRFRRGPLAADTLVTSSLPTAAAAPTAATTVPRARPAENARSACASIVRGLAFDAGSGGVRLAGLSRRLSVAVLRGEDRGRPCGRVPGDVENEKGAFFRLVNHQPVARQGDDRRNTPWARLSAIGRIRCILSPPLAFIVTSVADSGAAGSRSPRAGEPFEVNSARLHRPDRALLEVASTAST